MGGKGSGKRPKLTRQVHDTIIKHLKTGAFVTHAAEAAHVSRFAVAEWMKRGEAGEKQYVPFFEDVRAAQAEDAIVCAEPSIFQLIGAVDLVMQGRRVVARAQVPEAVRARRARGRRRRDCRERERRRSGCTTEDAHRVLSSR